MKTLRTILIILLGILPRLPGSDEEWPRHAKPIVAQALKTIPSVRNFRELYPNADTGFFGAGYPQTTLYLYFCTSLYGRYLVSLNIPIQLTTDRLAIKSWHEPFLEVEDVGEITVADDDQGYTTKDGWIRKFAADQFETLYRSHGGMESIGLSLIRDQPRKDFDRVWNPGHPDFVLRASTFSPQKGYGVQLPISYPAGTDDKDDRKNRVVELKSGRIVSVIDADPGYDRGLNFHQVAPPLWSADESLLLWKVEGKWNPDALVVLKIYRGHELWQLNLLKTAQRATLVRTKKAASKRYLAVKREHTGYGSAFPDGFTVDVATDGQDEKTISLPLGVHVDLTEDPKTEHGYPRILESYLDGTVTRDGKFVVERFHLGSRPKDSAINSSPPSTKSPTP